MVQNGGFRKGLQSADKDMDIAARWQPGGRHSTWAHAAGPGSGGRRPGSHKQSPRPVLLREWGAAVETLAGGEGRTRGRTAAARGSVS